MDPRGICRSHRNASGGVWVCGARAARYPTFHPRAGGQRAGRAHVDDSTRGRGILSPEWIRADRVRSGRRCRRFRSCHPTSPGKPAKRFGALPRKGHIQRSASSASRGKHPLIRREHLNTGASTSPAASRSRTSRRRWERGCSLAAATGTHSSRPTVSGDFRDAQTCMSSRPPFRYRGAQATMTVPLLRQGRVSSQRSLRRSRCPLNWLPHIQRQEHH